MTATFPFHLCLADVMDSVDRITASAGDDEAAHGMEDDLWERVLDYVAHHSTDPLAQAMCRAALTTRGVSFARWCA